ncbi:MAG TPA: hypothetical protein VHA53_10585 [Nitrolancea sp.]|nr:hypothetical protein [Nitrolancea sp.]
MRDDRSPWRELYLAGGISALMAALAYILATSIEFALPSAPTSGGAATLAYIAEHRAVYILQQILWQGPSILLIVVFLALYLALRDLHPSYALVGGILAVASWAVTLAYPATGGGAPALVYLSDQYVKATSDAERTAFATAAEGFIAQNYVATAMGVLEAIGILILSVVMLRGVFSKRVAYLGIATGLAGIVCESLKPTLGLGYIVYGLLMFIWLIVIGWQLIRLARDPEREARVSHIS